MLYGLYDLQLGGFKAGIVSDDYREIKDLTLLRIFEVHTDFLENGFCETWEEVFDIYTEDELIEAIGYEIKEVTKEQYDQIKNSEEYGLLTVVSSI